MQDGLQAFKGQNCSLRYVSSWEAWLPSISLGGKEFLIAPEGCRELNVALFFLAACRELLPHAKIGLDDHEPTPLDEYLAGRLLACLVAQLRKANLLPGGEVKGQLARLQIRNLLSQQGVVLPAAD
jgi:hypothetical protein